MNSEPNFVAKVPATFANSKASRFKNWGQPLSVAGSSLALTACSPSHQPASNAQTQLVISTASSATARESGDVPHPVPSAALAATAASSSSLGDYPEEWIRVAYQENRHLSCYELIYKRGCSEIRRGKVTLTITLKDDGSVSSHQEVGNQIQREPEVVARCLAKNIPRWHFHPPDGHVSTFPITLIFADKC